jgi:predicted nucleotidyltransferase
MLTKIQITLKFHLRQIFGILKTMFDYEKKALANISQELRKTLGSVIAGVYAFGSRVRGDHSALSDFDLFILVTEKNIEIERKIIGIIVDIESEYGLSFSPLIKTTRSFELEKNYNSPFYQNIKREAIVL